MDPQLFELIEPIMILTFLSGLAVGVKHMIWGKGPLRRVKRDENDGALEHRVAELEDLLEQQLDSPPEPRVATPV